jgi:hypothetical protein
MGETRGGPARNSTFKPGELAAVRHFWDTIVDGYRPKGLDIDGMLSEWTKGQRRRLSRAAQSDFDELVGCGCAPQVLAALLALFRGEPRIVGVWEQVLGSSVKRQKAIRALEGAALVLEEIFPTLTNSDYELVQPGLAGVKHISPPQLISELWFYRGLFNTAQELSHDPEIRSIREVARYVFTSYVKHATGSFRDRNVSGLLSEVIDSFDEVTQRMWRHRNYKRLEGHFRQVPRFLRALGVVLSRQT